MRVGTGYDSHRFDDSRALILGGVSIPDHAGLSGHSDGDAVAHAVIDAILGAAKHMHTVIASECTGCDLCVDPCPVDCIEMRPAEETTVGTWHWDLPEPGTGRLDIIATDSPAPDREEAA